MNPALLHLVAACRRPSHLRWHLAGIRRELGRPVWVAMGLATALFIVPVCLAALLTR